MSTQTDTIAENKVTDKLPNQWKVVLLNDDKTPMDLVIELLMKIFKHDYNSAKQIMLEIHNSGSGVAGVYSYEIAEQKGIETVNNARIQGYPLRATLEEDI